MGLRPNEPFVALCLIVNPLAVDRKYTSSPNFQIVGKCISSLDERLEYRVGDLKNGLTKMGIW